MTQEERNLLVKELSSRLPYLTYVEWNDGYALLTPDRLLAIISNHFGNDWKRPFLRPMSSMTKEEKCQFRKFVDWTYDCNWKSNTIEEILNENRIVSEYAIELFDWLNEHHFDYRGLIPMGLAIESIEGMYCVNC
jgi:hypothetical protein